MIADELITSPATFSPNRHYRYSLRRDIGGKGPPVLFIGLNPSTADEHKDDPTIRREMGFATNWGASVLYKVNLFALRSTSPKALRGHPHPVDHGDWIICNDWVIATLARHVHVHDGRVIAAWGTHGALQERGEKVRDLFRFLPGLRRVQLHHLGLTKNGHPRHPLYLRADTEPQVWA